MDKSGIAHRENEAGSDLEDEEEIDYNNFKGIYFNEDPDSKYIDPVTGAHFTHTDMCERLSKIAELQRRYEQRQTEQRTLKNKTLAAAFTGETERPTEKQEKPRVLLAEEREQAQINRLIDDVVSAKHAIGQEFKARKSKPQKSESRVPPHEELLKTAEAGLLHLNQRLRVGSRAYARGAQAASSNDYTMERTPVLNRKKQLPEHDDSLERRTFDSLSMKTAIKNRNAYKLSGLLADSYRESSGSRERFGSSRPKLEQEPFLFLHQRTSGGPPRKGPRGMLLRDDTQKSRNAGTIGVANSQNTRGAAPRNMIPLVQDNHSTAQLSVGNASSTSGVAALFPSTKEPVSNLKQHTQDQAFMKVSKYAKAYAVSVGRGGVLKAASGGRSVERRQGEGIQGSKPVVGSGAPDMSPGGPSFSGPGSKKGIYP